MARATRPLVMEKVLDRVWPEHRVEKDGTEHMVECPFCDTEKAKCAVNPDKGVFQCWVCGEAGPVHKLLFHLRDLRVITQTDVDAVIVGKRKARLTDTIQELTPKTKVKQKEQLWTAALPAVYPPKTQALEDMLAHNIIEAKIRNRAYEYLYFRGVTDDNIKDLRIAVNTDFGSRYYAHLFFPALGQWGRQLKFWTTRSLLPDAQPKTLHANGKYSRFSAKKVLMNEHLVVGTTVALCEGPFDAISIMNVTGLPACPLLGKILHPYQSNLLKERGVATLYLCLDEDAREFQAKIAEGEGKDFDVRQVSLAGGDPNDVPPEVLREAFKLARFGDMMRSRAQTIRC